MGLFGRDEGRACGEVVIFVGVAMTDGGRGVLGHLWGMEEGEGGELSRGLLGI